MKKDLPVPDHPILPHLNVICRKLDAGFPGFSVREGVFRYTQGSATLSANTAGGKCW